jgi:hypothetical protein
MACVGPQRHRGEGGGGGLHIYMMLIMPVTLTRTCRRLESIKLLIVEKQYFKELHRKQLHPGLWSANETMTDIHEVIWNSSTAEKASEDDALEVWNTRCCSVVTTGIATSWCIDVATENGNTYSDSRIYIIVQSNNSFYWVITIIYIYIYIYTHIYTIDYWTRRGCLTCKLIATDRISFISTPAAPHTHQQSSNSSLYDICIPIRSLCSLSHHRSKQWSAGWNDDSYIFCSYVSFSINRNQLC